MNDFNWRRYVGTQACVALLGDAVARGLLVWWSQGETGSDGRWIEPSKTPPRTEQKAPA